jgi:hypothetical protein
MATFMPGFDRPLYAYENCPNLPLPRRLGSFTEFVERVSIFSRDSLIDYGARLLWRDFTYKSANLPDQAMRLWLKRYAAELMVAGLMYGRRPGGLRVTREEFVNLAWELSQFREMEDPDSADAADQRARIHKQLTTFPRLAHLNGDDLRAVWALWSLSNVVISTHADVNVNPAQLVRSYMIYDRLRNAYGGDTNAEFRAIEQTLFLTSPRLLVRAACFLLGSCLDRPDQDTPGLFYPERGDREAFPPDVSFDDWMTVAQRFSVKASEFRELGKKLSGGHEPKSLRQAFRILQFNPIIELDDYPEQAFLIAGADRMFMAVSRFLFEDSVAHLGQRCGRNANGERGSAFEQYLRDVLADTAIRRVPERDTKTPDFEWLGTRYGVILEAKVKVVPDAAEHSADAFVAAWQNLSEAIDQASKYIELRPDVKARRWVLIVLVHDPVTSERTSFRYAASRWRMLDGTPLIALAVLDAQDIEHLIQTRSADDVGEMIERLWNQGLAAHPMNQPPDVAPYRETTFLPPVQTAYTDLFGFPPDVDGH